MNRLEESEARQEKAHHLSIRIRDTMFILVFVVICALAIVVGVQESQIASDEKTLTSLAQGNKKLLDAVANGPKQTQQVLAILIQRIDADIVEALRAAQEGRQPKFQPLPGASPVPPSGGGHATFPVPVPSPYPVPGPVVTVTVTATPPPPQPSPTPSPSPSPSCLAKIGPVGVCPQ